MAMCTVIVGNVGSGKTTLSQAISTVEQIPVLDLDTIYWEKNVIAVPRARELVLKSLSQFCVRYPRWVIEGCYGDIIEAALAHQPKLLFLQPGKDVCLSNCRNRIWQPHKYKSKAEQDAYLEVFLPWIASYYERDGPMSLKEHLALFEAYRGPKQMLMQIPPLLSLSSLEFVALLK